MNFLPSFRPVACAALAVTLCACATPANRRELYNTGAANGAWHDYAREHAPDVPAGTTVTVEANSSTPRSRVHGDRTPLSPPSVPAPDATAPPPPAPAPAAPAPVTAPPPPAVPEAVPTAPAPVTDATGAAIPGTAPATTTTTDTAIPGAPAPPQ